MQQSRLAHIWQEKKTSNYFLFDEPYSLQKYILTENYLNYKFKTKVYFFYNLHFHLLETYMYRKASRAYISVRKKGFRSIHNSSAAHMHLARNVSLFYNRLKCCPKISPPPPMKNKSGVIVLTKTDNS